MQKDIFKYRLKLTKTDELRYISHLDWQNLIQKIFRRCSIKLVLSEGFNKMPKISYSPALPIFIESYCELVNFQTQEPLKEDFIENFEKNSPNGIKIIELKKINPDLQEPKSLENLAQWAKYRAIIKNDKKNIYNSDEIRYIINKCLSSDEILITKKTKKGIEKTINYRKSLQSLEFNNDDEIEFILKVGHNEEIPALRADEFIKKFFVDNNNFKIKREEFFDSTFNVI